jgi:hypothetical protein
VHNILHYPEAIRRFGSALNFCTDAFEMAHKENSKIPGKRVNWHVSWEQQLLNHVTRHECIDEIAPDPMKDRVSVIRDKGHVPGGDMAHKRFHDCGAILASCCPAQPPPCTENFQALINRCLEDDARLGPAPTVVPNRLKELKKAIINVDHKRQDVVRAGNNIGVAAGNETWYAKVGPIS